MRFKWLGFCTLCLSASVSAQSYWDAVFEVAKQDPAYAALKAAGQSSSALMDIEQARRFPTVSGTLSRIDGASSLSQTSDAIQTGVALTYPVYDNNEQASRDELALAEGAMEFAEAAKSFDRVLLDTADAYIALWEAKQIKASLESSQQSVNKLSVRLDLALKEGEASYLDAARLAEHKLTLETKLLDVDFQIEEAKSRWTHQLSLDMPMPEISTFNFEVGNNAEINSLRETLAQARAKTALVKSEDGLSVDLNAAYYNRQYDQGSDTSDVTWSLSATYPLFDGGLLVSRASREKLKADSTADELRALEHQQSLSVQRLRLYVKSKAAYIEKKQRQCDQRAEVLVKTTERYELGRGDVNDVLESDLALNTCKADLSEAKATIYRKYHQLSRLNGTLSKLYGGYR